MIGHTLAHDTQGRVGMTTAWSVVGLFLLFGGWLGWRRLSDTAGDVSPTDTSVRESGQEAARRVLVPIPSATTSEGADIEKLLELAGTYKAAGDGKAAERVYRRVVAVDPDNDEARKALRHLGYDGQWFESYEELSQYRRTEAKRMLEEHGLVRFNEEWVPQADLHYLRMGWTKQEDGEWVAPDELEEGDR